MNNDPNSTISEIANFFSFLKDFFIILGVVFAVLAYFNEKIRSQQNASLQYVQNFNTGELLSAKNTIYAFWTELDPSLLRHLSADNRGWYATKLLARPGITEHESAVVTIISFFDNVHQCVKNNICDKEIIDENFRAYASNFLCLYKGFIDKLAGMDYVTTEIIGNGLKELSNKNKLCELY